MRDMKSSAPIWPSVLIVAALIGVGGCGLSDYQKRMDEQRARIQDFDDANRLLDDPIERPIIKAPDGNDFTDKAAWHFETFLRLPKGYGTREKDKTVYGQPKWPYVFVRYTGG